MEHIDNPSVDVCSVYIDIERYVPSSGISKIISDQNLKNNYSNKY